MLRSHKDESTKARQVATNARSAAAMLDQTTERELYALFRVYFSDAERDRSWSLWSVLDTMPEGPPPSRALVDAVLTLFQDALLLPDYSEVGLSLLRASRGRAWFWTRWSYEESKHLLALQEWLIRCAGWEDSTVRAFSEDLLGKCYWEPPCTDAACVLVDALLYELHEIEGLTALQAQADQEKQGLLSALCGYIRADDEAQRDFLVESLQIVGRSYPEQLAEAIQAVAAGHELPELATQLHAYLTA